MGGLLWNMYDFSINRTFSKLEVLVTARVSYKCFARGEGDFVEPLNHYHEGGTNTHWCHLHDNGFYLF